VDLVKFLFYIYRYNPDCIHLLGQYRTALPREFAVIFISKMLGISVLYEIKAGSFIDSYNKGGFWYKKQIAFVVRNSANILVEGKKYIKFLKENFNKSSVYFPNFVPINEIPNFERKKINTNPLKILFVGYCYRGKGVFQLLDGCDLAARNGLSVSLTLIGDEDIDFKKYIDSKIISYNLIVRRLGKQGHDVVLNEMINNDIYCYPSMHSGEGHNNSINEALMNEMVVVFPENIGFLEEFLTSENSLILNSVSALSISESIKKIFFRHEIYMLKAKKGKRLILEKFNENNAREIISKVYTSL
jgi:glycosyltransferase involved in cell wall biosynthesis